MLKELSKHLNSIGIPSELIQPSGAQFDSDLAIPCFSLAKSLKKSPQSIAEDFVAEISHQHIERVEAVAGYLNVWLKSLSIATHVSTGADYSSKDSVNKTAIVEVGSLNMSKPFSVGHLRPTFHGDCIARLYRNAGYNVITDNHVGDWGTPFGKWVTGVKRYSSDQDVDEKGIKELARVYIQISEDEKKLEGDELGELKSEVQSWLHKLAAGDKEAKSYHAKFLQLSFQHMHDVMGRMGVVTDIELGESFYIERAMQLVEELVRKNVAVKQDDNSVIIDLNSEAIETPLLITKSDGSALYATSDIATAAYRQETYKPDLVIIPTGQEQKFYFEQLNAAIKIAGLGTVIHHHWFGLINQVNEDGSVSKMSSRRGVVLVEDLLDKAESLAVELNPEAKPDDVKKIALGSIKFADLSQDPKTDMIFDWGKIFSLSGYSAPYIMYANVRIYSIIDKSTKDPEFNSSYDFKQESQLLSKLLTYPSIVERATYDFAPQKIANYLFELAKELNVYYEATRIIGSNEESSRLWLLQKVGQNLTHGFSLLGIEMPEEM